MRVRLLFNQQDKHQRLIFLHNWNLRDLSKLKDFKNNKIGKNQ